MGNKLFCVGTQAPAEVAPTLEGVALRQGGEPQGTEASHIPTLAEDQRTGTDREQSGLSAPDQSTGLEAGEQ